MRRHDSHSRPAARKPDAVPDKARERRERVEARAATENIFEGELAKRDVSDSYEDEVFNVSNLPAPGEVSQERPPRRRARRR